MKWRVISVVSTIMGWSLQEMVRMSRGYGHIGQTAHRYAVNALIQLGIQDEGAKIVHNQSPHLRQLSN